MHKKKIAVLFSLCLACSPICYALAMPGGGQHQAAGPHYHNQAQAQIQEIQSSIQVKSVQEKEQRNMAVTEGLSIGFGAFMIVASLACYATGVGAPIGVDAYTPVEMNQEIAQLAQSVGQMQSQIEQRAATKEQASAQIMQATEQSLNQGIQQTESLAEQLRNSMDSVAQDMMSMVNNTLV